MTNNFSPEISGLTTAQSQQLTSLRIERAVNLVGRATMRFHDPGYGLSATDAFKIGQSVSVSDPRTSATLFQGEVHTVALDQSHDQRVPQLVVTADEPTRALTTSRPPRVHQNSTVSQLLDRILVDHGLSADVRGMESRLSERIEYLLQTSTDLAFLDELVRRRGGMWWFEPSGKFVVGDPGARPDPVASLQYGDTGETPLLAFSVRASAAQPKTVVSRGWDPGTGKVVEGRHDRAVQDESAFARPARTATKKLEVTTNAGEPATQQEAAHLAQAIHLSASSDVVSGRGTVRVDGRLEPGVVVEVVDAGPSSGKYLVTRAEHVYDRRGFHTTFHVGAYRPRGLVDTLGHSGAADTRIDGVLVGVVTDLQDPEGLGRVKLKFPVLSDGKVAVASAWARVASFDAGKGRGASFLPEIEDEVLVAFENGSTRRPVVIGSLFGGTKKPPELANLLSGNRKAVAKRRITSRTGHVIELFDADSPAQSEVLLQHGPKKYNIKLKDDGIAIEALQGDITIGTGRASITLTKSGDVTIEGLNITLKAKDSIAVEATKDATIKANLNLTLKASTNLSAEGGLVSVKSSGPAAIKGNPVAIN